MRRAGPCLALFLLTTPAHASEDAANPLAPVLAVVEEIQTEPGMIHASIGFAALSVSTQNAAPAAGYRPDAAMIPASTLKLVTTATGLETLGPDFTFKTHLQYTGSLSPDGALEGNVIIKGGGDPTLGASRIINTFAPWKDALDESGINAIHGQIVGDASIFGTQLRPDSWQWNHIGNYFAAGACGLTFHQNLFSATFQTGSSGSPAPLLHTDPKLPGIEFINEMQVGPAGSGDQGYIFGSAYANLLYLRGTLPAGRSSFTIKGSLPDPAFFCARAFTKYLNDQNLTVSSNPNTVRLLNIAGETLPARTTIFTQESDPLSSLIVLTNHKSNNLSAECIHRMIGYKASGKGTTTAAAKATIDYWSARGIDTSGFAMADGCGLSRVNTMTARQLTKLLKHMIHSENAKPFYASIPIAGQSGTLRSIGRGTPSEGNVHAKSGTLNRVKCYAGYANTRSGNQYAFTLFINNHDCTDTQIVAKIVRVWNALVTL
ncbi:MAG: D-alanyl-D-alanine carboxypeptidase/D-alanyl-D-alanine-endopeptidase [Verrucomicrobiota bacterium]